MAGEIAQDVAVTLTLIGAAMGAGGAIASQVIAGVITDRREQRRSREEAERWKLEADAKRRDRQLDRKIELFAQLLSETQNVLNSTQMYGNLNQETAESLVAASWQVLAITEEIGILAPELHEYAQSVAKATGNTVKAFRLRDALPLGTKKRRAAAHQATRAHEGLHSWADLFRQEARSYVIHGPVTPHNDADAALTASLEAWDKKLGL
ncbi:hypothetical protein ACFVGV_06030 [Pseudarthrobacter scleromae]|uniref:hypothetical protein n=1 Tax=Pseudarthrobacter scleromae TaxID=158897 RepID=UPI003641D3C7